MSEPGSRRGRTHDAEGAREAILDAAEAVFAEHGFDGARMDAIAEKAGYNKSLVFQYFKDKVNLYVEVTKRADREMTKMQELLLPSLFENEDITFDARTFRKALETIVGLVFDYVAEHPRLIRIIHWEQAENWQTYKQVFSQFETNDAEPLSVLFQMARKKGVLRSDFPPLIQLSLVMQICLSFLAWMPLYQMVIPDEDFSSAEAPARARTFIINFVVSGIMIDPTDPYT